MSTQNDVSEVGPLIRVRSRVAFAQASVEFTSGTFFHRVLHA